MVQVISPPPTTKLIILLLIYRAGIVYSTIGSLFPFARSNLMNDFVFYNLLIYLFMFENAAPRFVIVEILLYVRQLSVRRNMLKSM